MRLARIALPVGGLVALATWTTLDAAAPAAQGSLITFQAGGVARAQDVNDNFAFVLNEIAAVQASIANLDLQGTLQMQPTGTDGDQSIFFADGGSPTANYLRWEDSVSLACTPLGTIGAGFVLNIANNTDAAWMFRNGPDIEFVVDEMGAVSIDQTLTSNGSCDLAETFVGPAGVELPPGTVVVLDPQVPEGILPATRERDPTVVGVVTTTPGVLLNGPTSAALPWARELADLQRRSAETGTTDPQRAAALEELLDAFPRGDVAVALVGRVSVRVDTTRGPIRAGDVLTTSTTPGQAVRLDGAGPGFATALADCDGGCDEVLALLRPSSNATPATIQGTALATARATTHLVRDPRLRPDSAPHVTFHADPGAHHWISARGAGWFELTLATAPATDVPFSWTAR